MLGDESPVNTREPPQRLARRIDRKEAVEPAAIGVTCRRNSRFRAPIKGGSRNNDPAVRRRFSISQVFCRMALAFSSMVA